jgi:hypothetical protein
MRFLMSFNVLFVDSVQIIGFVERAVVHAEDRHDDSSRWSTNATKDEDSFSDLLGNSTMDVLEEMLEVRFIIVSFTFKN